MTYTSAIQKKQEAIRLEREANEELRNLIALRKFPTDEQFEALRQTEIELAKEEVASDNITASLQASLRTMTAGQTK